VAVEALILDAQERLLLLERGPDARDEKGKLEGVGGRVEGPDLRAELFREIAEEIGSDLVLGSLTFLELKSDVIADSGKRWVVASFLCEFISGEPVVQEPGKINCIHWVELQYVSDSSLSSSCRQSIASLRAHLGGELT
jgi:8-oxo-dGTP pyrophosphatase MutT (NUDIX family)